eukprot:gene16952-biopygen14365
MQGRGGSRQAADKKRGENKRRREGAGKRAARSADEPITPHALTSFGKPSKPSLGAIGRLQYVDANV